MHDLELGPHFFAPRFFILLPAPNDQSLLKTVSLLEGSRSEGRDEGVLPLLKRWRSRWGLFTSPSSFHASVRMPV